MLAKFRLLLRFIHYSLISLICLAFILWYHTPTKFALTPLTSYFILMALILPFFRLKWPHYFSSGPDNFVSYRKKALDLYHQDKASHHPRGRWSTKGVSTNPYEFTNPYTQDYDASLNWGYHLAKPLLVSLLFILFAPLFFLYAWWQAKKPR